MKRISLFLSLTLLVFVVSCTTNFSTTTTATQPTVTTTTTLDLSRIYSEVYARIYEDLYEEIRAEVLTNLSEERFETIYQQVLADIQDRVEAGEIEVTAISLIEMIYQVAAQEATAVVGVTNYNASGAIQSVGSGVIFKNIGDKYYVLTNEHVVENGSTYRIQFEDGSSIEAILRGVDTLVDIAVLYFTSANSYAVAAFGDSDAVTKGTLVLAVGNPSGYEYFGTMTLGIVSGTKRYFDIDNDNVKDLFVPYIQHDAAINSGNSGGPLFNLDGKIIGINVIKISSVEIEGMGFAIPANLARDVAEDIIEYGVSKQKPVLGIQFIDIALNYSYFAQQGITLPPGVVKGFYILQVYPDLSLSNYVTIGDILIRIGDIQIESSLQFVTEFSSRYRVGDIVSITILRGGQTLTIENIELKARLN
ncbi:MAG: trypsin-like peptidase domain-containing protein [Bacillus subtilis]|nr:trypsin-like peptidase domain-containing protein [Bacillus subtilis]